MPKQLTLNLTTKQRRELEDLRDHADLPYLRERAAALLKIADGDSARTVAAHGLLKKRWYYTLGRWVKRYQKDGIEGLKIKAGRGRKPAFSPSTSKRR
jgi:transposase